MERKLIYKILLILGVIGLFSYYAFPLQKRINLGLDLQGGMHLLLKVDTSHLDGQAKLDACDRAVEVIRPFGAARCCRPGPRPCRGGDGTGPGPCSA